jgi:hypothetical protein
VQLPRDVTPKKTRRPCDEAFHSVPSELQFQCDTALAWLAAPASVDAHFRPIIAVKSRKQGKAALVKRLNRQCVRRSMRAGRNCSTCGTAAAFA